MRGAIKPKMHSARRALRGAGAQSAAQAQEAAAAGRRPEPDGVLKLGPINPPSGCTFHTRCHYAVERCRIETPALKEVAPGHLVGGDKSGGAHLCADPARAHSARA